MFRSYAAKSARLSRAWGEVFLELLKPGVTELSPLVVTIAAFDDRRLPIEDMSIRHALDRFLAAKQNCRTVASTIFPNSLWRPSASNDAQDLYDRYESVWPRVRRCRLNSNGVYFRRLTAYQPKADVPNLAPVNQLKHVIDTYVAGTHRHSALQASIFDPTRDHSAARQRGFPCLQQVAFAVADGELGVTGFYALQHHVTKAYGNYLGLCWLGRFMAQQMKLNLARVTCVASIVKLGDPGKGELSGLKALVEQQLPTHQEQPV
jgi:hypothetical protein